MGYVFFRIVFDALFWTFHPFSPFAYVDYGAPIRTRARARKKDEPPFYEKVNRFFFGPTSRRRTPARVERRILAEIRAQKGRIGLGDVLRVTGLPRDAADPLMSRLLLDYDGEVEVSEEGGIVYRFEALRKTVDEAPTERPKPIWARLERLAPLTGNELGHEPAHRRPQRLQPADELVRAQQRPHVREGRLARPMSQHQLPRPARLPPVGTAVALGVVPLVFSIALFALPLARAAYRPCKERRVARENGRRAMLREIFEKAGARRGDGRFAPRRLEAGRGSEAGPKELTREVVALGGDVDYESGEVRYRFPDFEAESAALAAEREAAAESEAKLGEVVFSSEN